MDLIASEVTLWDLRPLYGDLGALFGVRLPPGAWFPVDGYFLLGLSFRSLGILLIWCAIFSNVDPSLARSFLLTVAFLELLLFMVLLLLSSLK
jgi:hypothetical protein